MPPDAEEVFKFPSTNAAYNDVVDIIYIRKKFVEDINEISEYILLHEIAHVFEAKKRFEYGLFLSIINPEDLPSDGINHLVERKILTGAEITVDKILMENGFLRCSDNLTREVLKSFMQKPKNTRILNTRMNYETSFSQLFFGSYSDKFKGIIKRNMKFDLGYDFFMKANSILDRFDIKDFKGYIPATIDLFSHLYGIELEDVIIDLNDYTPLHTYPQWKEDISEITTFKFLDRDTSIIPLDLRQNG